MIWVSAALGLDLMFWLAMLAFAIKDMRAEGFNAVARPAGLVLGCLVLNAIAFVVLWS